MTVNLSAISGYIVLLSLARQVLSMDGAVHETDEGHQVEQEPETTSKIQDDAEHKAEEEGQSESEPEMLCYKDQGYHEMEFSSMGNESDLHDRKGSCKKNPGHILFIPADQFTAEHIPVKHRDSLVFAFITTMISLTVRLTIRHTSLDRPPNYPLHNRRGQHGMTVYGSGRVYRLGKKRTSENSIAKCPCRACKQNPAQAKTQWWTLQVITAMHVVFDTSEAECTSCDLFYDNDKALGDCPRLEGGEVWSCDVDMDYCIINCVSHDQDVFHKLEKTLKQRDDLRAELKKRYKSYEDTSGSTVVLISHPHGLSKHVTVGDMEGFRKFKFVYGTESCPGSSGGTGIMLGKWRTLMSETDILHSGCREKGKNEGHYW